MFYGSLSGSREFIQHSAGLDDTRNILYDFSLFIPIIIQ